MPQNASKILTHLTNHVADAENLHKELIAHSKSLTSPEKASGLRNAADAHAGAVQTLHDACVILVQPEHGNPKP